MRALRNLLKRNTPPSTDLSQLELQLMSEQAQADTASTPLLTERSNNSYARLAAGAALLMTATAAATYFLTKKFDPSNISSPENCPMNAENSTLTLYFTYQDINITGTSPVMDPAFTQKIGTWFCSQLLCAATAMTSAVSMYAFGACVDSDRTFDDSMTFKGCTQIETAGIVAKAKALCGISGNHTVRLFSGAGVSPAEIANGGNISGVDTFKITAEKRI